MGDRSEVLSTPSACARGGEAWRRNVWWPVYISLLLQVSLTLACTKALSKTLYNIHGSSHVPAARLTSTSTGSCRRRWLNISAVPWKILFKNHPAKLVLRDPWGKPLHQGTQRVRLCIRFFAICWNFGQDSSSCGTKYLNLSYGITLPSFALLWGFLL